MSTLLATADDLARAVDGTLPDTVPVNTMWVVVAAILVLFMTAVSWLAACVGLLAGSVETAGAFSFVVMFLPYVSSAFVPPRRCRRRCTPSPPTSR